MGVDSLCKLCEHFFNILLRSKHEDELELRDLHVNWIIIFAEKNTYIVS